MQRWVDKVAIVTGASAGIGAAIAASLVRQGIIVAGFARRVERVEALSERLKGEKGKLHAVKVDLTQENDIIEGVQWVISQLGPISILINNAGVLRVGSLSGGETEKWRQVFDTNVIGLSIATREVIQNMRAENIDGHIVHINSIGGHKVPSFPDLNVYSASKFAVTALTETLRLELNQLGSKIKVSSVSPGGVRTEIIQASGMEISEEILKTVPFLNPEDVANAVDFVLSTPPHVQIHELIIKPIGEKE